MGEFTGKGGLAKEFIAEGADTIEEMEKLAEEYREEGFNAFLGDHYNKAILLLDNSIKLYRTTGNDEGVAKALNYQGIVYSGMGNENYAMDCYLEGLTIVLSKNYSHMAPFFYNNIGSMFQEVHQHEKALSYFMKAEEALGTGRCRKSDKYTMLCLVTYLNLCISNTALGDYRIAARYLERTKVYANKDGAAKGYILSVLVAEMRLNWIMGKLDLVNANIEKIMEGVETDLDNIDYVVELSNICDLFRDMERYDYWQQVISAFRDVANKQDTIYLKLKSCEMWMEYYKHFEETEKYRDLCEEYVELCFKQKANSEQERANSINTKIELQLKEMERQEAEKNSFTDRLTGLGNRFKLETKCKEFVAECVEKEIPLLVGIIDIDCFKEANDTYGHVRGDKYLEMLSRILKVPVDKKGEVFRYGGDEFVVLIKDPHIDKIEHYGRMIKSALHDCHMENKNSKVIPELTVSQGFMIFNNVRPDDKLERLLKKADKALYTVKERGRNDYYIAVDDEE